MRALALLPPLLLLLLLLLPVPLSLFYHYRYCDCVPAPAVRVLMPLLVVMPLLLRYVTWLGQNCRVFNVGQYRPSAGKGGRPIRVTVGVPRTAP